MSYFLFLFSRNFVKFTQRHKLVNSTKVVSIDSDIKILILMTYIKCQEKTFSTFEDSMLHAKL